MIDNVLEIIKEEVDISLKLKMNDNRHQYVHLAPVVNMEGKPAITENTICMSLVKIEEDRTNMCDSAPREIVGNEVEYYGPPVKLNLYVLFSASYADGQEKNYKEALKRISYVIGFFQSKSVFTTANTPRLDHAYGKINAELYPLGIEEQSHFWGMIGSLYRPSVLYRFRTLMVQEKHVTAISGPSEGFEIDLGIKN